MISGKGADVNPTAAGSKKKESFLRAYKDLNCPTCGSNVYWGTHRCRRCGAEFPEKLVSEIDRRTMMHYIPLDYGAIKKEQNLSNVIILTVSALIILLIISYLLSKSIREDIQVYYIFSWAFFVITITSAMLSIFFMSETETGILTKYTIMLSLIFMGICGFAIGFVGFIQVALFTASNFEVLVCAAMVVLATLSIAAARKAWPFLTAGQIITISVATVFLSWPLMKALVRVDWVGEFWLSAGNPFATFIIFSIGIIAISAGTSTIYHNQEFKIRMNVCYPIWFSGVTFLSLGTFFRAALFRSNINLTYLEAMMLILGIILTLTGLLLYLRKKLSENYIRSHLRTAQLRLIDADAQYAKQKYALARERYERILAESPVLAFATTNSHPALELLGINFVYKPTPVDVKSKDKKRGVNTKDTESDKIDTHGQNSEDGTVIFPADKDIEESGNAPSHADSDIEVGDSTEDQSDTDEELQDYTEIEDDEERELRQAEALALLKKSTFYEKSGQRRKALVCLERSLKLDRSRAETWIRLGHIMSQLGGSWDRIRGYYEWVIDLKLKAAAEWVETQDVPPQYTLWLLEETVVLKNAMLGIGRTLRTLKTVEGKKPDLAGTRKSMGSRVSRKREHVF